MRSSIACSRCRRSKVKCINNGVNTTCRACETTGRECTYPTPAGNVAAAVARRESAAAAAAASGGSGSASAGSVAAAVVEAGAHSHGETPRRQRPKKPAAPAASHGASANYSPRAMVDALDPSLLTAKVWTELFDIYQVHFSTDLPFLHPPSFLKPLRQSGLHSPTSDSNTGDAERRASSPQPPASPILLLAFLALTSRFHSALVSHHSPPTATRPSNPLVAADYYAAAAKARLPGNWGESLGAPDLERTQALLMLALHDWGMCRGVKAWISAGVALRSAQVLGMQIEEQFDDTPLSRALALQVDGEQFGASAKVVKPVLSKSEQFIEQEIRRRTLWSCFIMDRYMSNGKYRPQMLHVQDLRIQLPSSERAFSFGEKVQTPMLSGEFDGPYPVRAFSRLGTGGGESRGSLNGDSSHSRDNEEEGRWEAGTSEGVLSRFIKIQNIYGRIIEWSCSGGRKREQYPPWDPRTTFYALKRVLASFAENLPRDMTLTPANTSAHITTRTFTSYILMHTVHQLCHVILHREYLPFVPLRCSKPQGPLDPSFKTEEYGPPPEFWEQSARECFKSSRDLVDLLRTCQEWGALVETPVIGFAMYISAFMGVYAINFPWMDPNGYMHTKSASSGPGINHGAESARKALELVGQMRKRLQMADGWFKTIKRSHLYYVRIKKDFKRNVRALEADHADRPSFEAYRNLSHREASVGLDEFKLIEKTLKDFGPQEDEDLEMADAPLEETNSHDGVSENGSTAVKSDTHEIPDSTSDSASVRQERWNAINTVAAAASQAASHRHSISSVHGPLPSPKISNLLQPTEQGASHYDRTAGIYKGHRLPSPTPSAAPHHSHHQHHHAQLPFPIPSDPARNATHSLQQQLHSNSAPSAHPHAPQSHSSHPHHPPHPSPPQPPASYPSSSYQHQPWTFEMSEKWLNSLETRFGSDDIVAFIAGYSWQDIAAAAAKTGAAGGWLSIVWSPVGSGVNGNTNGS